MGYEIPVIEKCCFYFPRRPSLLVYGYAKLIITILLEAINISIVAKEKSPTLTSLVIGIQAALLLIDIAKTVIFLIGCHKNIVLCIAWFYTYGLYMFIFKTIFMTLLCVLAGVFIFSTIIGFLFNGYLLLLIRSELIDIKNKTSKPCEFVNKLANPECAIKIEVVDEVPAIPILPNDVLFVNGTKYNDINGEVIVKNVEHNNENQPNEMPLGVKT